MKIKNKISIIALFALFILIMSGCEDMFEPAVENHKENDDLYGMPSWATGLLGHAYISNPLGSWSFNDVATDDAVSNNPDNGYRLMATGSWRANNNPMDRWQYLRASWQYLNQFLFIADNVNWAEDPLVAEMFRDRMKGDAFGMRALYMYHLLLNHGGWSENGELLGIPIIKEPEDLNSEFDLPRNTFQECIDQLYADVDSAIMLLPTEYGEISNNNQVPEKYRAKGVTAGQYTRVFGDNGKNRMSSRIAKAIRAQAALLAASPAYSEGTNVTWEQAANNMAEVLSALGSNPLTELDPKGNKWYESSTDIQNLPAGVNPKEMLWRGNKEENGSLDLERDNYPPTLFGSGRVNPTQNLVDAFPMANGYPITDPASGYDPNNPYNGRDPRLDLYIIRNGSQAGPQNTVINTAADGGDNNALNRVETSTRTGYYLKKLLVQSVNANPSSETQAYHYKPFIRYTEIFLGYAEAANEAWGPTGTGSHGYSAYDVIKAIRQRAGIAGNDPYLELVKADKDKMRELIQNERRLELCFEGFRFWDLRRWKNDITEPAKGMRIESGDYTVLESVERRAYQDYMYYGPIPYGEVIKFDNLLQNKGW